MLLPHIKRLFGSGRLAYGTDKPARVYWHIFLFFTLFCVKPRMLYAALLGSGLVLLGILNRYSIYQLLCRDRHQLLFLL